MTSIQHRLYLERAEITESKKTELLEWEDAQTTTAHKGHTVSSKTSGATGPKEDQDPHLTGMPMDSLVHKGTVDGKPFKVHNHVGSLKLITKHTPSEKQAIAHHLKKNGYDHKFDDSPSYRL